MFTNTPLLIFNAVVFLNESNHRKCVKRKEKLGLKHMLGFLLAKNPKCPNVIAYKHTHMLTHVCAHTCTQVWIPGNTVVLKAKH